MRSADWTYVMRRTVSPRPSGRPLPRVANRRCIVAVVALTMVAAAGCSTLDIESAGPVEVTNVELADATTTDSNDLEPASDADLETVVADTDTDLAMVDGDGETGSIAPQAGELNATDGVATGDDQEIIGGDAEAAAGNDESTTNDSPEADDETDTEDEQQDTDEEEESDLDGAPAVITTGAWTPAEDDLGVRVRATPAGEVLGYIVRGEIARTTGRGRVVNSVEWGEVTLEDGSTGWIAIAFLVAAEDPDLAGATPTVAPTETPTTEPPSVEATAVPAPATSVPSTATPVPSNQPSPVTVGNGATTVFASDVPGGLVLLADFADPNSATGDLIANGTQMRIVSDQGWRVNGVAYVQVSVNGVTGWVDGGQLYTEG